MLPQRERKIFVVFPSEKRKKIERVRERERKGKREKRRVKERRRDRVMDREKKGKEKETRHRERETCVEGKSTGRVGRGFNRRVQPQLSLAAFQFLKWPARLLRGR